jgi:hypothetical protein
MQSATRALEKLAATDEVERVVRVAPVGCAATDRDQLTVAKLAEVVRDQALRLAERVRELAHRVIAARQLSE